MADISPNKLKALKLSSVACAPVPKVGGAHEWLSAADPTNMFSQCPNPSTFMSSEPVWIHPALPGNGECRARQSFTVCCLCFMVSASCHCAKFCANITCAARSLWHKSKKQNTPRDQLCEHPGVSSGSREVLCPAFGTLPCT